MANQTYGNGNDCYVLPLATVADTAAHVSGVIDCRRWEVIGLQLIAAGGTGTLDGAWKIEVSNDFMANATAAPYGQAPNAATAHWTDITASKIWVDAVAAVAHGTASTTNQYIQPTTGIGWRAMRVTFTGTTGSATVGAILFAKSWS
jgi:hypothetical protein